MFAPFNFDPVDMPTSARKLRERVRAFLREQEVNWDPAQKAKSWTGFDREFSREVGKQGWIGMTWPKAYGGGDYSMIERYIVLEEMLAVGAPVFAHWIADRQSGPLLLRVGTEAQKSQYLSPITRGEYAFCIGLSEPDSGSDLASVRTRAERIPGGWRLNGRKIWTTNAHFCEYMIALVRTSGGAKDRQVGLSQFLIDLQSSGVEVRPINDLTSEAHFNEVTFDDVLLGEDALVGAEGQGWAQVNSELAFERSGPDRYLSLYPLLTSLIDEVRQSSGQMDINQRRIGQAFAELAVLREMSVSVAGQLQRGDAPNNEAAVMKELGVGLEQRIPDLVRECAGSQPAARDLSEMLLVATQLAPTFSLRGGTREIVRGIIARGLGLR